MENQLCQECGDLPGTHEVMGLVLCVQCIDLELSYWNENMDADEAAMFAERAAAGKRNYP